jgi:hypothetical protein
LVCELVDTVTLKNPRRLPTMDRESKLGTDRLALRLIVLFALMPTIPALCQCKPATTEKTTWGGNTNVVMQEPKPLRTVQGVVRDRMDNRLTGVLVEIYDKPEIAVQNPSPSRVGQKRIAACVTNETGLFLSMRRRVIMSYDSARLPNGMSPPFLCE